jgi:hypothetical protein
MPLSAFIIQSSMNNDPGALLLFETLGGTAAYFLSTASTSKMPLNYGASQMGISGSLMGLTSGAFLGGMLAYRETVTRSGFFGGNYTSKQLQYNLMGLLGYSGGLIGSYTGAYIANKYNFTEGQSAAIASYWRNTLLTGIGLGLSFNIFSNNDFNTSSAYLLACSGAGLFVGAKLYKADNYTLGDVRFMETAAYLGALTGLGLDNATGASYTTINDFGYTYRTHDESTRFSMITSGFVIGQIIGALGVRGKNYTPSQGSMCYLSTIGGALIGTGLGAAIDAGNKDVEKPIMFLCSSIGGWIGYFLSSSLYGSSASVSALDNIQFSINPASIVAAARNQNIQSTFASVRWQF